MKRVWVLTEGFDRDPNQPTREAKVRGVFMTRDSALFAAARLHGHGVQGSRDDNEELYIEYAGGWFEIQCFEVQS